MISKRYCDVLAAGILAAASLPAINGCNGDTARADKAPPPPRWLTIVTPHNETIQHAFGRAFMDAYAKKTGNSVFIRWVGRPTPECLNYINDVSVRRDASESRDSADVMFGGGISDHQVLAEKNLSRAVKMDDAAGRIPPEVGGLPTRDKEGKWVATGLSSFGFVFNERDAGLRGIAAPKSWDDLADPRFAGWMGIADPEMSSSHRACMVVVLEKYGWNEGWSRLIRMLANARGLVERSSVALQQTRNGVFLASFAVNFDGLETQAESGGVKYTNPRVRRL